MKSLFSQIAKFGVVGVVAFIIDYIVLVSCIEMLGIHYLISSFISFSVSTIFNFITSSLWVFGSDGKGKFLLFTILSIVGLFLNQILMIVGVDIIGIHYILVKISATGIVMVYNFISRKLFLYQS